MARLKTWRSKAEYQKAWWRAHPEKVSEYAKKRDPEKRRLQVRLSAAKHGRKHKLKGLYGISLREYDKMLQNQDRACAICHGQPCYGKKSFSVDHDHNTSMARGLLCDGCNRGLGFFKDDPKLLDKAAVYVRLKRYGPPVKKAGKKDAKDTSTDADIDVDVIPNSAE